MNEFGITLLIYLPILFLWRILNSSIVRFFLSIFFYLIFPITIFLSFEDKIFIPFLKTALRIISGILKLFFNEELVDSVVISFLNSFNRKLIGTKKFNKEDILILLPHCLQHHTCDKMITRTIKNCVKCGKCVIKDFSKLNDEHNINIRIVEGGTAARNTIILLKPKLIIAVACERDLAEGMIDVLGIPTIGIANQRPNGPCFDTTVNFNKVKLVLKEFVRGF